MAKAARVDDVVLYQDGRVEVKYTEGDVPLPASWGGTSEIFPSREEFIAALFRAEQDGAQYLKMFQAAVGYKADPAFGLTFRSKCVGKTTTLDLTGQTRVVAIE